MSDRVRDIEVYLFEAARKEPYLGPLGPRDFRTSRGYLVRGHSGTIYPETDRSIVVRIETETGIVGWGETYGLVAPRAVSELIADVAADFVLGQDSADPAAIHDRLYSLMRVRGYTGGFWLDALAGLDIALWDIAAKAAGMSLARHLAPDAGRRAIRGSVSGLPGATLADRVAGAVRWAEQGFDSFKIALAVADDAATEFAALREALGPSAKIAIDLHWLATAEMALAECARLTPYDPWFVEAPCLPEDVPGLSAVCAGTALPIAVGEEWRTGFDARSRLETGIAIVQPEMGHTGVTEFMRIARAAVASGRTLMPHATVGMGIFLGASLQAAAAAGAACHEFQHSVIVDNARYLENPPACDATGFSIPDGLGHGVEPSAAGLKQLSELFAS
jgi:galactonate dehydratase